MRVLALTKRMATCNAQKTDMFVIYAKKKNCWTKYTNYL